MNVKAVMDPGANARAEDVSREAESWFARLRSPDCSAAERARFESWRAADPRHRSAYAVTERVFLRVGELAGDEAIAVAFAEARIPAPPAPGLWAGIRMRLFAPAPLLAGAAVLAFLSVAIYRGFLLPDTYRTEIGEQRTLALADGSTITLDTATTVRVDFDKTQRRVQLDDGQAQFKVAHDPARRFVVSAGASAITALGTVFDVRKQRGEVTVTLVQGRVQVTNVLPDVPWAARQPAILRPGERLVVFESARIPEKVAVDLEVASGWAQGNLVFKSASLAEAIEEVNRYTESKIRIGDQKLAEMPISGVFHVGDATAVVLALERSFAIQAIQDSAGNTLLVRSP